MGKAWDIFNMKNFGDIPHFETYVENFRNISLKLYDLLPCHVYSAQGLPCIAVTKMNKIQLELLKDINVLLM